jgi:hypothetical protein
LPDGKQALVAILLPDGSLLDVAHANVKVLLLGADELERRQATPDVVLCLLAEHHERRDVGAELFCSDNLQHPLRQSVRKKIIEKHAKLHTILKQALKSVHFVAILNPNSFQCSAVKQFTFEYS